MDAATVFSIANTFALLCWIYIIGVARWTPKIFQIARYAVPILFTILYVTCLLTAGPVEGGGFRSLEAVSKLFSNEWAILGGWVHYLAFDFFVGCWILEKSKKEGIAHWWIVVPMFLTFMFGPFGLTIFLIVLGIRKSKQRKIA